MQIEQWRFGEIGRGVLFEHGRNRSILAGTVLRRPEDEIVEVSLWVACVEWANFEPVVGQPEVHKEMFYFPEICTHFFDEFGK
jgi:hypothetical protein